MKEGIRKVQFRAIDDYFVLVETESAADEAKAEAAEKNKGKSKSKKTMIKRLRAARLSGLYVGVRLFLTIAVVILLSSGSNGQQASDRTDTSIVTPQSTTNASANPQTTQPIAPLTIDDAVRLSLLQASKLQQAQLNELIAGEDVRQARTAFLPKIVIPSTYIYTSPATGLSGQMTPRPPSFIANNAVNEYESGVSVAGEIDIARRLQAALARSKALLEAAHAGTEVARRELVLGTREAYFGLALAALRRVAAEQNLAVAEEFERITNLMFTGGEVAQVDLTRARLQTSRRRDELALARVEESASSDSLRVLIGYDFTTPVVTAELINMVPLPNEIERFTADAISRRPEFTQFDAQRRAAEQEIRLARGERRPQLSYSVIGGFDTDSLKASPLKEHSGVAATISLTIPLFDWGASKSRELQATLRKQLIESDRMLALRTLAQQFYTARAQAIAAASRIQLLTASLTDAQRNLDTSIARYRAGEAAIVEVTDAQNSLIAQRASLYQAIFDYQVARARLEQATGQ